MGDRTLNVVAYVLDAVIIAMYGLSALWPEQAFWFHLANAVSAPPLLVIEWRTKAYPVIPLTAFFGVIGLVGAINAI